MTFTINAWVDKAIPELEIKEIESGEVIAYWAGKACSRLFTNGVISIEELQQTSKTTIKKLVKRLILQYASEQMQTTGVSSSS